MQLKQLVKLLLSAPEKGVASVAFDRSGFQYHGREQRAALAESAREAGLKF